MARIDYSNVSISLQQFEAVASGKYNAGEVKLTGEHSLGRMNNHVHMTRLNNDTISHAEVIAIKNAFIRALSDGGVDGVEIGKVRAKLGLAPSGAADAKLAERSIRPLTRQQIREILDQYAEVLNVRTSDEIAANVPQQTRQARATARQTVNVDLDANRAAESNAALAAFQKVLAGDVDFITDVEYTPLLNEAKRQLAALYERCGDNPSVERQAKAACRLPGGQTVEIDTGMNEVEYAEKLFQTIARLEYIDIPKWRETAARNEYRDLDHQGRLAWIADLPNKDVPLVTGRMAAVLALQEKGIADYEALSLVNKITFDSVIDLLYNLEDPENREGWDMSRDSIVAILRQYPTHDDGSSGCVHIPATSPSQYNKAVRAFFKGVADVAPPAPPGFKPFVKEVFDDLRARFGEDIVPADIKFNRFIDERGLNRLVQVEGDGDHAVEVTRARLDNLRGPILEMARRHCAERALRVFADSVAKALGVKLANEQMIAISLNAGHPDLIERLLQCENPAQTAAVLDSVRADTEKAVRKCVILDRYRLRDDFKKLVREEISALTGIPAESLKGNALPDHRLLVLAGRVADKINTGKVQADTEEEILAKFREEARLFAGERTALLGRIDGLDVTDGTKAELKKWILAQDKISFINLDDILPRMENIDDRAWRLSEALKTMRQKGANALPADKNAVYMAMKKLAEEIDELVFAQFDSRGIVADPPELSTLGTLVSIIALGRFVGIREDIADFVARQDVSAEMAVSAEDQDHASVWAHRFATFAAKNIAEANAQIRDGIASGNPDAMTGQAIVQGCREAGLTAVSPEEAVALFTTGKVLAAEFFKAIDGLPAVATPQMIRTIVGAVIARHASQIRDGRPMPILLATPAERKSAIVDRIAGGDGRAAQKARQLLEAKLGPEPQNPEEKTFGIAARNIRVFMLRGVLNDLKSIAKGGKGAYLGADFNRTTVNLAGVGIVSKDNSVEAADCFARFVTGRVDATYATLAPKEKAKADIAMAIAAQTSQNAIQIGVSSMMHPEGQTIGFLPTIRGGGQSGEWKESMEFGQNGELKICMTAELDPMSVIFPNNEVEMCAPGSKVKYTANFTISRAELGRVAKFDFGKYDGGKINGRLDTHQPGDICDGAIDLIPADYRINTSIDIDFQGEFK